MTILIASAYLGLSAISLVTPQFSLVCDRKPLPPAVEIFRSQEFSFDLRKGVWCERVCRGMPKRIVGQTRGLVVLADSYVEGDSLKWSYDRNIRIMSMSKEGPKRVPVLTASSRCRETKFLGFSLNPAREMNLRQLSKPCLASRACVAAARALMEKNRRAQMLNP